MQVVQMTLDEKLIKNVDKVVKQLNTTRSAFTREALAEALERLKIKSLEQQHIAGYKQKPVKKGEFDVWSNEQAWGD